MNAALPMEDHVYRYHLLRGAIERFSKNLAELDESQLAAAHAQAEKTFALESLVLSSGEARGILVSPSKVDAAVAGVLSRYPDRQEFLSDLRVNGLTEHALRRALHRELVFAGVLDRVAAARPCVSQEDARLYYERDADRFALSERRRLRQILITVNDDIKENQRDVARLRIETIAAELKQDPNRFSDYARRYSECPSALRDGKLGDVQRGQLYPSLDVALFSMSEGTVSDPIETEMGFHVLWLERVFPSRRLAFPAVEGRIREALDRRNKRRWQQAFLERLRKQKREDDS